MTAIVDFLNTIFWGYILVYGLLAVGVFFTIRLGFMQFRHFGELFRVIRKETREHQCTRAIVVAHNAHFDAGFINAAIERCGIKRNPFHPFTYFDTATLAGLAYGQTVLAKACAEAGISFDNGEAHSAAYDAERTAELFCEIVNRWKESGGWVPQFS